MEWLGVLLPRDEHNPALVRARDRLADAAKAGRWDVVFRLLDADNDADGGADSDADGDGGASWSAPGVNDWRVGGRTFFAPLHQAAWLGAPESVIRGLLDRGALRTLPDAHGRRPVDIAHERGHTHLAEVLTPTFVHPLLPATLESMTDRLAALVIETTASVLDPAVRIRHVDVAILAEAGTEIWFPIPGMYGGFRLALFRGRLHVESWSRVVGGSGRAHVLTATRTTLVDEGFV